MGIGFYNVCILDRKAGTYSNANRSFSERPSDEDRLMFNLKNVFL